MVPFFLFPTNKTGFGKIYYLLTSVELESNIFRNGTVRRRRFDDGL